MRLFCSIDPKEKVNKERAITDLLQGLLVSDAVIILHDVESYIRDNSVVPEAVIAPEMES